MSTPDREAVLKIMRERGGAWTLDELTAATGVPRERVANAVQNAPRDTFKKAHGKRVVGNVKHTLYELGARSLPPVTTGSVWAI